MISSQNLLKKLPFLEKVKNATSFLVAWRKYCCSNSSSR